LAYETKEAVPVEEGPAWPCGISLPPFWVPPLALKVSYLEPSMFISTQAFKSGENANLLLLKLITLCPREVSKGFVAEILSFS
jgi:hypothetical protein